MNLLSRFRRFRLVAALGLAALVTATSTFGSAVLLADTGPDGGEGAADSEVVITTSCGGVLNSIVRTDNAATQVAPGAAFVNIPNASAAVTVPANTSDCVKVTYTTEAAAFGPDAVDFCYVRALLNGVAMNPADSFQVLISEDSSAQAAAYVWVRRVTAGFFPTTFNAVIQWRGEDGDTTCFRDDSTLVVERLN